MVDFAGVVCARLNASGLGIEFRVHHDPPIIPTIHETRVPFVYSSDDMVRISLDGVGCRVWLPVCHSRIVLFADPDFYDNLVGYIVRYLEED